METGVHLRRLLLHLHQRQQLPAEEEEEEAAEEVVVEGVAVEEVLREEVAQVEILEEILEEAAVAEEAQAGAAAVEGVPEEEGAAVLRTVEVAEDPQVDLEVELLVGEAVPAVLPAEVLPTLLALRLPLVGLPLSEELLEAQELRVQVQLQPQEPLAMSVRVLLAEPTPTRIPTHLQVCLPWARPLLQVAQELLALSALLELPALA